MYSEKYEKKQRKIKKIVSNQKKAKKLTKKTSRKRCSKGKILRKAYITHRNNKEIVVPATCVKDMGKPGKYPNNQLALSLSAEDDEMKLGNFGYHSIETKTELQRHRALGKVLREAYNNDYLPLFRKLIALSTLNKNTNPKLNKIFKQDANWLKNKYKR